MNEHPYKKLKADYNHLMGMTWDLFEFGIKEEERLKEAVVNAFHQFDKIVESEDIDVIKKIALNARDLMKKTLSAVKPPISHP